MRKAALATLAAGALSIITASVVFAVVLINRIESGSERQARASLTAAGQSWATATGDGMQVVLTGEAPDEAARLRAASVLSQVFGPDHVRNLATVAVATPVTPPNFQLEILRNGDNLSLFGLIPRARNGKGPVEALADLRSVRVVNLVEPVDWAAPAGWKAAQDFAVDLIHALPQAKISMVPGHMNIEVASPSAEARSALLARIERTRPEGLEIESNIVAPRAVISPYSALFEYGDAAIHIGCTAPTAEATEIILSAARRAGYQGPATCRIGLGAPSADWPTVIAGGIDAMAQFGGGRLFVENADLHLTAPAGFDTARFEEITRAFSASLPPPYVLKASLPAPEPENQADNGGKPRFLARRLESGRVVISGMLFDEADRETARAYAHAKFGADVVEDRTFASDNAPEGWIQRVFAAIDALSLMNTGSVHIEEKGIQVEGKGQVEGLEAAIRETLRAKTQPGLTFDVAVDELPPPPPEEPEGPSPAECEAEIAALLDGNQILFAPNSATIEPESLVTIRDIAKVLNECQSADFEIGGHTDSQGREEMNLNLSQQRAESVLDALLSRRMLLGNLVAKGYGETEPIADNDTEEGRAANRRIAFKAILPDDGDGTAEDAELQETAPLQRPEGVTPEMEESDEPN